MTEIKTTKIPRRQKCVDKDHPYIGGSVDVIDDTLGKPQSQVNQERISEEANLDSKIAAEKTRAQGVEGGLNTRLQTVEQLASISVGGGDIGIGTAADFESDDPEDLAKVPTVGAMLGGANDGVYDISARHSGATYADLAAALGTNGANIPQNLRKGGMSIRFVQSSDNKYVQYRLMAQAFSTTVSDWQGVDEEPSDKSHNFVESGGVWNNLSIKKLSANLSPSGYNSAILPLIPGRIYRISTDTPDWPVTEIAYDSSSRFALKHGGNFDYVVLKNENFYPFELTAEEGNEYFIHAKANVGVSVEFTIEDITELRSSYEYFKKLLIKPGAPSERTVKLLSNREYKITVDKPDWNTSADASSNRFALRYYPEGSSSAVNIATCKGNVQFSTVYFKTLPNIEDYYIYAATNENIIFSIEDVTVHENTTDLIKPLWDDYSIYKEWTADTLYKEGERVKVTSETETSAYICSTEHTSSSSFNVSNWTKIIKDKDIKNLYTGDIYKSETFGKWLKGQVENLVYNGEIGDSISVDLPAELFISGTLLGVGGNSYPVIPRRQRAMIMLPMAPWFAGYGRGYSLQLTPHVDEGKQFPQAINVNQVSMPLESEPFTVSSFLNDDAYSDLVVIVINYGSNYESWGQIQAALDNNLHFTLTITKTVECNKKGLDILINKFINLETDNNLLWQQNIKFEYGTIIDETGENEDPVEIDSKIRPVGYFKLPQNTASITVIPPTDLHPSFWYNGLWFYDANHTLVGRFTSSYDSEHTFVVPTNAVYFRIRLFSASNLVGNYYGSKYYVTNPKLFGWKIIPNKNTSVEPKLRHIKLSQWNVGHFNGGAIGGIDTTQEGWETLANKTKNVLIDIRADILILNEDRTCWDKQNQHNAYDDWYKQFYPYFYLTEQDNTEAIASKFPIKSVNRVLLPSEVRYYYEYILDMFGEDILVVNVHFSPYTAADRETDAAGIANRYKNYSKVIISGDFNSGNNSESDADILNGQIKPFTDLGYIPANWGFFGKLITHQTGKSLDNTFVKGFNLDYAVAGLEKASSDHLPTKVELTIEI